MPGSTKLFQIPGDKRSMNQRLEARISADRSVAVTLLGDIDTPLKARVKDISGSGIGLELEQAVTAGTALKIELDDALVLGEVVYCRRDGVSFTVGVRLEQELTGLAELRRTVEAFAGDCRASFLHPAV
jgi:hypothetical protein